jgi:exosortase/archaeosortase family protein
VKKFIQKIKPVLSPYWGIILFVVALFGANIFWKTIISGDEDSPAVLLLNRFDISAPFAAMSKHIANIVLAVMHFFGYQITLIDNIFLTYPNGHGIKVVWGCTGIKQTFIFVCIIIFAAGKWKNKLWFIPTGIFCCYLINILRITAITMIVKNHQELFDFYHSFVFKYLYYGLIFLMWLFWVEKIVNRKLKYRAGVH